MATVKAECSSCGGTGLYRGMCEEPGTAVVCLNCDGTGCRTVEYTPFMQRKPRADVKWVFRSRGTFIAGPIGPGGTPISYADFQAGWMPGGAK